MAGNVADLNHKVRHAAGGPDALSPNDIGAEPSGLSSSTVTAMTAKYTPSATGDAASVVVDRPSGVIEGLRRAYFYGNSYTQDNGNASSNYTDRLRARLQPQLWFNGGTLATNATDECSAAFGTAVFLCPGSNAGTAFPTFQAATFPQYAFFGGVVIADVIRNDAGWDGQTASSGTTAKSRAGFTNHVDALIRLFRSQYRIPGSYAASVTTTSASATVSSTAVTAGFRGMPITGAGIPANSYVGTVTEATFKLSSSASSQVDVNATASATITATIAPARPSGWTSAVNGYGTAGNISYTSTNATVSTYTFYLSAAAKCAWTTLAIDDAGFGVGGSTYSVSVNGGAAITGTTANQTRKSLASAALGFGQMCVDLGTLPSGYNTVAITNTGAAGKYLYDDCILVESPTPPTVIVPKSLNLGSTGYATYVTGGGAGAGTATDLIYDGILNAVAARFPSDSSVLVPDGKTAGWNPVTMIGTSDGSGVHKNDRGERWTADWLMSVLNTLQPRAGLVKV